jgi:hypothetical protein
MASVATPVAVFVATTLTPGIKAPVASPTEPLKVALIPTCADAETESRRQETKTSTHADREHVFLMKPYPLFQSLVGKLICDAGKESQRELKGEAADRT